MNHLNIALAGTMKSLPLLVFPNKQRVKPSPIPVSFSFSAFQCCRKVLLFDIAIIFFP